MPNPLKRLILLLLTAGIMINLCGIFAVAHADTSQTSNPSECAQDPTKCDSASFKLNWYLEAEGQKVDEATLKGGVGAVIVRLINQLSYVIGSFALLALIIGGFTYLTSAGQERLITKAKDIVKYAVIGLIVALSAFYITLFVQTIFYEHG